MLPCSTLVTNSVKAGGETMHSSFFGSATWWSYPIGPWQILTTLHACSGLIVVQRACLLNLDIRLHHVTLNLTIHLLAITSCPGPSAGDYGAYALATWWQVSLGKGWWSLVLFMLTLHAGSLSIVSKSNTSSDSSRDTFSFFVIHFPYIISPMYITIKVVYVDFVVLQSTHHSSHVNDTWYHKGGIFRKRANKVPSRVVPPKVLSKVIVWR